MSRPETLDGLITALTELPGLPPADRAARAPELQEAAKGVLAEVRRAAVVEATAQGEDLGLSSARVRADAVPDRQLLGDAIRILLELTDYNPADLMTALRPRIGLDVMARRVQIGVKNLPPGTFTGGPGTAGQRRALAAAADRSMRILGGQG